PHTNRASDLYKAPTRKQAETRFNLTFISTNMSGEERSPWQLQILLTTLLAMQAQEGASEQHSTGGLRDSCNRRSQRGLPKVTSHRTNVELVHNSIRVEVRSTPVLARATEITGKRTNVKLIHN